MLQWDTRGRNRHLSFLLSCPPLSIGFTMFSIRIVSSLSIQEHRVVIHRISPPQLRFDYVFSNYADVPISVTKPKLPSHRYDGLIEVSCIPTLWVAASYFIVLFPNPVIRPCLFYTFLYRLVPSVDCSVFIGWRLTGTDQVRLDRLFSHAYIERKVTAHWSFNTQPEDLAVLYESRVFSIGWQLSILGKKILLVFCVIYWIN